MAEGFDRAGSAILTEQMEMLREVVLLRLSDAAAERRRVALVRELLWAGGELSRALVNHTRHAMVDCCGTPGTGDLAADTRALCEALQRYSDLVREVAAEFGPAVAATSGMSEA